MKLTYSASAAASSAECPPKDTYTLELISTDNPERKAAYQSTTVYETQVRFNFKIVDFDYDPDYNDKNWEGAEVRDWFTFSKEDTESGREWEVWPNDKSKAFALISAFLGRPPEEGEDIDLSKFVGRRIKATVEPKASGYPKITNPLRARQVKKPQPVVEDEDFDVDDML